MTYERTMNQMTLSTIQESEKETNTDFSETDSDNKSTYVTAK